MEKVLLINADDADEVRVAVVEDGRLEEIYVEAGVDPVAKGNVYVGRVVNVEPGIGAAFVDLGRGVTGFLHVSDIHLPDADARATRDVEGAPEAAGEGPPEAPDASGDFGYSEGSGEDASRDDRAGVGPEADPDGDEGPETTGAPQGGSEGARTPIAVEADAGSNGPASSPAAARSDAGGDAPEGAVPTVAAATARPRRSRGGGRRIDEVTAPDEMLLVQISRGPVGRKGPTLTTRISLPGRYVVLCANSTRSGVSRRIDDPADRGRMRRLLGDLVLPEGMSVILRTASHGRTPAEMQADVDALFRRWEGLRAKMLEGGRPRAVHEESDLALRAARDILPPDVTRVVVDDAETARRVEEYLHALSPPRPLVTPEPECAYDEDADPEAQPAPTPVAEPGPVAATPPAASLPRVEVHDGAIPLFHAHDVETQVEDAFRRTVRLPSGGSLVIDPTEALVAIDVNSGRLLEEHDLEATALKTNLEAAVEAARQVRLRDLGGVIVLDFIDMDDSANVREVEKAFREAVKRDRARIRLGRIGPFGCLELTRQRIRPALASVTHTSCPACQGTGRRRQASGLALRVLRELRARAARSRGRGGFDVRVPPAVHDHLRRRKQDALRRLEKGMSGPLRLQADPSLPYGGWAIRGVPPAEARPERAPAAGPESA